MLSSEIRDSFLNFFKSKDHAIVPSAPLLPTAPNLLFTNAGMNPFVPYFLGERKPPHPRVADTQKCIRAGGKHNDLDDVGFDTYHHTFFEMLGNWSFGDYFKEEAIAFAWELLTQVWGFPKERLHATVYQPGPGEPASFDEEAHRYWKAIFQAEGLDPEKHLHTGGKADNFWMMGETGPCGPCSEIHVDLTPEGDGGGSLINADSPRCMEIWNLVFMQFNATADGEFLPLAQKHVDTGMGFERIAGIFASTEGLKDFSKEPSNYDSDLFQDLFQHLEGLCHHRYGGSVPKDRNRLSPAESGDCAFRILGDHIRTLAFSIADGILPGNEGRNYVLRRILRRAVLWGKKLELPSGFFAGMADPLVNKMGKAFPELKTHRDLIRKVIASEESAFEKTIDRGLQMIEKLPLKPGDTLSGEDTFTLYDTYGFPVDLTRIVAEERGLKMDMEGFDRAMNAQREKARQARKTEVVSVTEGLEEGRTEFLGYSRDEEDRTEARIIGEATEQNALYLELDRTPFYAEMGGQVGDAGWIEYQGERFPVTNTVKDPSGRIHHRVEGGIDSGHPLRDLVDAEVAVGIDTERRRAIERNHTATHLLHWALRETLGAHLQQAGSLVAPDRLRFDFTHYEAIPAETLARIERMVSEAILDNAPIQAYEVAFDEKPSDVIAFFGEKYGDRVRVVDIGGFSKELCGGTHLVATGEAGPFLILSEGAVAAGTRRIEAITGEAALERIQAQNNLLHSMARQLSCRPGDLVHRLDSMLARQQELEKELRRVEQRKEAETTEKLASRALDRDGVQWIIEEVPDKPAGELKGLAAGLAKKTGPSVVVMGSAHEGKCSLVTIASTEAVAKGHSAGEIIQTLCRNLGGKGGGKPDFAMGGAKDEGRLPEVLEELRRNL